MRLQNVFLLVLVLVITFMVYLPSLNNEFTDWDDPDYITENGNIKALNWESIKTIFTTMHRDQYKPLTFLTFALEYHYVRLKPFLYHFDNLILHVINSALLFWLIILFTRNTPVALLTALLFGIHPLHVESVAWATERKDVLFSLFFLASLISYAYFNKSRKLLPYCFSFIWIVLSLMAKPQALLFVFVLVIIDYFIYHNVNKKTLLEKLPFLLLLIVFLPILFMSSKNVGSKQLEATMFIQYFFNAFYALVFYLYKLCAPFNLSSLYQVASQSSGPTLVLYYCSPVIVAVLGLIVYRSMKKTGKVAFAALFYLINMLVVLWVYPSGPAVVADRYAYIPSIGFFYLLSEGIVWLFSNRLQKGTFYRTATAMVVLVAMVVLSVQTWNRCKVWKDSVTLWSDVIKKFPASTMAHNNLGLFYAQHGATDEAIEHCREALRFDSHLAGARVTIGIALASQGKIDEAFEQFKEELRMHDRSAEAHYNIGNILAGQGSLDEALVHYKEALRCKPLYVEAINNLGNVLASQGKVNDAIQLYNKALSINPDYAEAYNNLGNAYAGQEKLPEAIDQYEKALQLNPFNVLAHNNLGIMLERQGNKDAALAHFNEALRIEPNFEPARENIGRLLNPAGMR